MEASGSSTSTILRLLVRYALRSAQLTDARHKSMDDKRFKYARFVLGGSGAEEIGESPFLCQSAVQLWGQSVKFAMDAGMIVQC